MIIQIRGTSGSGKSTIVKELMEEKALSGSKLRVTEEGRRQPLGYIVSGGGPQIAVPGHYETACGGCDTLPSYDRIFELIRQSRAMGWNVLFEGLLVSEEVKRTFQLHQDYPGELVVIFLNTPVEVCLESIRARRAARGDERPLKEDNTRNRVKTIIRACTILLEAGVKVYETDDRVQADQWVREYLR